MTVAHNVTFDAAEGAYVVANTPLFLLRKLLSDPLIVALAHDTSGDDLFDALTAATSRPPASLSDRVLPFILLVALAIKGDLQSLYRALALPPLDAKSHWFPYLANVLLETTRPYSVTTTVVSGLAGRPQAQLLTTASGASHFGSSTSTSSSSTAPAP
jgi:hypothetical protein